MRSNSFSAASPAPKSSQNGYLVVVYIAGWYLFSMSISIYNKWMFGSGLNFSFPLFITAFHQVCLLLLSGAGLFFRPKLRPTVNVSEVSSAEGTLAKFCASLVMSAGAYAINILPCAVASAGDIGLSNVSLRYISLTLYTMLKTSSLAFVLLFGLLFRLERFNWRLVAIVAVMCVSVMMMTQKPAQDRDENQVLGIMLILGASFVSGIRWCFTQLLLKKSDYTRNPVSTIFYISPAMTVVLFLFALMVEGWPSFISSDIWAAKGTACTIFLMIIPGILAFLMTLFEFQLLSVAPVLTLSIAGIFKELLTIMFSSAIFGDRLSMLNCIGVVITSIDVLWYNYYRFVEKDATDESYTALSGSEEGEGIELKQH
ncbi:hypothetical protein CLUG_03057 [Clavispora lusitaniae ATCC 42720]|uniref:Sugar phosphate transporter domain-containing protein n=2 Tax=Clavispora lusitaniae TaxID=36911 RepID=C4Y3E4_CLAL4|nr:uncharacterized protein CLUG_03057 [Clavispora lusitaniae ATCC 42720]EEQ38931.1 hypothetical protein CLUG_03057 [Clavispora lusitaniae ATCC 42720]KAF5210906.1 Triose-phosphate Transporter [Clavispora lusitaniae]OVF07549.1 putative nucleotide-sugar transporter [Clavispora lusitaniae]